MEVMHMCSYEFDVALCSIRVKNVALSFLLVQHPCIWALRCNSPEDFTIYTAPLKVDFQ